jgi:hypothetical protein
MRLLRPRLAPPSGHAPVGLVIAATLIVVLSACDGEISGQQPNGEPGGQEPLTFNPDALGLSTGQNEDAEAESGDAADGAAAAQDPPDGDSAAMQGPESGGVELDEIDGDVGLSVTAWCLCAFKSVQLKLQPRVTNHGHETIDAGAGRNGPLVLLVDREPPNEWSADRRNGEPVPAIAVPHTSPEVWALPANEDGLARELEDRNGFTWATHWPSSLMIEPGHSFEDPEPREGVLVFEVPDEFVENDTVVGLVGLGWLDRRGELKALTFVDNWGRQAQPDTF